MTDKWHQTLLLDQTAFGKFYKYNSDLPSKKSKRKRRFLNDEKSVNDESVPFFAKELFLILF